MKLPEYLVVPFQANITEAQKVKGLAHQLTSEQLQQVIDAHVGKGFKLSHTIDVPVHVKPGCFGQPQSLTITNLVFEK